MTLRYPKSTKPLCYFSHFDFPYDTRWYSWKEKTGRRGHATIAMLCPDGAFEDTVYYGISYCSPLDNFCYETGRQEAELNALSIMALHSKLGNDADEHVLVETGLAGVYQEPSGLNVRLNGTLACMLMEQAFEDALLSGSVKWLRKTCEAGFDFRKDRPSKTDKAVRGMTAILQGRSPETQQAIKKGKDYVKGTLKGPLEDRKTDEFTPDMERMALRHTRRGL